MIVKNKLIILILLLLLACSKQTSNQEDLIFTSNYPLKLIVQEIFGDTASVQCIVPPNVSEHTFEPKVSDIAKLERAKVVFYVSDNLDNWATKNIENRLAILYLLPEDKIYFFEDGKTPDPHFWTSPKTVFLIVDTLASILIKQFPNFQQKILENSKKFKNSLLILNDTLESLFSKIQGKYVFLFHPSFRYFIRDYGLNYGGSIEEAPGAEPTPSHLNNLIKKIRETGTKAIFTEPQLNPHTAKVLAKNAKVKLYEVDPLGNYEIKNYEQFVLKNAKTFWEALK